MKKFYDTKKLKTTNNFFEKQQKKIPYEYKKIIENKQLSNKNKINENLFDQAIIEQDISMESYRTKSEGTS